MPLSFSVGKDVALHKPQSPSINGSVNLKEELKMCMKRLQTYEQTTDNWSKQLLVHVNQQQVLKPIKSGNKLSLRQISEASNECGYYIWIFIFDTLENKLAAPLNKEFSNRICDSSSPVWTLYRSKWVLLSRLFLFRLFFFRSTSLAKIFSCFIFTR